MPFLPLRIESYPARDTRIRPTGWEEAGPKTWKPCFFRVLAALLSAAGSIVWGPASATAEGPPRAEAEEPGGGSQIVAERVIMGVRVGISDHRNEETFRKYEVFVNLALPWAWRSQTGWTLSTHIDVTGAALNGGGVTGFLGSAGPALEVCRVGGRVILEAGVGPAYLAEDRYGKEDLGGHLQFLSHLGLSLLLLRGLGVAYEFQHISNAGVQRRNPGLNVHSVELSYRF